MEKILSEQDYIFKQTNDGRIQLKQLIILKNILTHIEQLEKKELTQIQSKIEELLFRLIINNRITSDILARYVSYIFIHLFDKGRNSHLTDLINSVIELFEQKENNKNISDNIKCTFMWIIGYVSKRCEYKSPAIGAFTEALIDICTNREISDLFLNESIKLISKFLNMNINNVFGNKIPEIYKLISKKERNILNKKYILKCIYGSLLYYENKDLLSMNFYHKKYNFLMEILENYFQIREESINNLAIKTFIFLHDKIIFKEETIQDYLDFDDNKKEKNIEKMILKNNELNNFIHVIYYFSQIDLMKFYVNKTYDNGTRILTHLDIIIHYIKENKQLININELIIDEIYELLINSYSLHIYLTSLTFIEGLDIYYNTNDLTMVKSAEKEEEINNRKKIEEEVNQKIILLFRIFIKSIYIPSHRMHFLSHLFLKLNEVQTYIDKLTEDNTVTIKDLSVLIENGIINKVYSIPQINVLLLSLLEISETNPELFEQNYNSFQEISNNISFFLTSGIRSFRIFITKFVCNLSYFLPSYRNSIISLVLSLVESSYNRVSKLKNVMLYFSDVNGTEFNKSLNVHKNLSLFKDICNCLAMVLCTTRHKSKGISLKLVEESFNKAKLIILGKKLISEINKDEFNENICNNLEEDSIDYLNKYLTSYKENGWIIIQGIFSLDKIFNLKEMKNLFYLFKYTFNKKVCELKVEKLKSKEYKDNLISEFFNKKESLHCLNKFIISIKNDANILIRFKEDIIELLGHILDFYLPKQNMDFIGFYQHHLNEAYNDVRKIIYEIFYNLPIEYYEKDFNSLIYSLSYNIAGNNYSFRYLYNYYFDLLNKTDTFFCLENLNIDEDTYPNIYFIDSYYSPLVYKNIVNKEDEIIQNYPNSKTFNFIETSTILLIKIFSSDKLSMKNKNSIIQYFLNSITEIVIRGINFKSIYAKEKDDLYHICNYNKLLNIVMFSYLLLKHAVKNKLNIFQDLELFTNTKMIFDLCYKVDDLGILNIISCEGLSYLINLYNKKEETLEHYLRLSEIRFNSIKSIPKSNDYIYSFYLLGNIFRNVEYSYIRPFIDKYMNFIISCFNPNDEIAMNSYVVQSLYIICDALIKEKEYDKVVKIAQIFKMNIIYINGPNKHFFKKKAVHETLNEIKLLILYIKVYENISENEKILTKIILKKIIGDELYKSKYFAKYVLYLINKIIENNLVNEFSQFLFDLNFLEFLFKHKKQFSNNLLSFNIIKYLLDNKYKQIESVAKTIDKDKCYIKQKISSYIHQINDLYHNNKYYYYINKLYKYYNNNEITNDKYFTIDFNNFDKMFSNYKLIIVYKTLIINYISKNYKNIDDSINFLKIILQKKITLYRDTLENPQKEKNLDAGDEGLKDNQDNLHIDNSKILFDFKNLKYIFYINLQKFLIKSISQNLIKYVQEIISTKINNSNKNIIEKSKIDVLSKLMSVSMILFQSEDSWEIKYLGINLLYKLIKLFSNIKDSRTDDDSLLIQQYEVQLFSCIKNIFNSKSKVPPNFKSIKKGFNLIYLFLTISISNDIEYIQKFNEYIHFMDFIENKYTEKKEIKFGNNNFNFSSEKEENIIKYQFFILLCRLFVSCYTKKDFNIKYIQKIKEIKTIEIHSSFMAEEIKNYFKERFREKAFNFCDNLKHYIYLMFESFVQQKDDNNDLNTNLYYSNKLRLKYASLFLTVISIILHNNLIKNYEEVFDTAFLLFLYKLIFYLIKIINEYKESKEAIVYIIDIFSSIISNKDLKINYEIVSLLLDEFNSIVQINDLKENKNLLSLFQKISDNLTINGNIINKENCVFLMKKETESIKLLRNNYSKAFDSFFMNIYYNHILRILKKCQEKDFENEFIQYNKLIFELYLNNNDNAINKLLLEKIYTILLNITIETKNFFKLFTIELIGTLIKLNSNFQKYFTLFYIIIQYISKSTNDELIKEIEILYITESLKSENNLYDISNKSLFVSITQMNNLKLIQFINLYLSEILNNKKGFKFSQEMQKLILLYMQNEKNNELRKDIIKSIIKYLNENKDIMIIKDACVFVLGIIKINKDDNNLIYEDEIKNLFNEEFKNQMNELTKVNENSKNDNNEGTKENNNDNEGDEDDFDEVGE